MRVHDNWATEMFDAAPAAPHIGPFAGARFLAAWHRSLGDGARVLLVEGEEGLVPLMRTGAALEFAGDGDVTDYHSTRGAGAAELLAEYLAGLDATTPFRFDSMPIEAAEVVAKAVELAGCPAPLRRHEVAPALTLPATFDEYLAVLGKKNRHEMRRKRRRFEGALGPPVLERREGPGPVAEFAAMHRRSAGDKGSFMDGAREAFFAALQRDAGAVVDALVDGDGRVHAMAVGFEEPDGYYLYNSAYEPDVREHSPGIVLLEMLIRAAIAAGRTRFDLLKGDEAYKYRLGAQPRPLYEVTGVVGGRR